MARRASQRHGVLVIDKPAGLTSHDVVARLRRLTGEQRVGHAGTLDPMATGVLPVCVGQATRLLEYLSQAGKTYLAEVALGVQTETDDLEGAILRTAPVPDLSAEQVRAVLAGFEGPQLQAPPAYAAIKVGGRKLYELARAGQAADVPPRPVTIERLALLDWSPPAMRLLVDCSKGTYIRSLARDIGARIGCGGYLHRLRRTRTGPFCLEDAWTLEELTEQYAPATWHTLAMHPDRLLFDWPAICLDARATTAWRTGTPVHGPAMPADTRARVYSIDGEFLGIGRYEAGLDRWRPEKVLSLGESHGL
jgi:tRNA pseudouridine55 synthase